MMEGGRARLIRCVKRLKEEEEKEKHGAGCISLLCHDETAAE
jgi:hypothetical protein